MPTVVSHVKLSLHILHASLESSYNFGIYCCTCTAYFCLMAAFLGIPVEALLLCSFRQFAYDARGKQSRRNQHNQVSSLHKSRLKLKQSLMQLQRYNSHCHSGQTAFTVMLSIFVATCAAVHFDACPLLPPHPTLHTAHLVCAACLLLNTQQAKSSEGTGFQRDPLMTFDIGIDQSCMCGCTAAGAFGTRGS